MSATTRKPKKPSMIELTSKYANNEDACRKFFFDAVYPDGWVCNRCGSHHCHPIAGRNNVW